MNIDTPQAERPKATVQRLNGYLNRVIPVLDSAGKVVHYAVKPLMVELRLRDVMQIVVGATILAVPVAFTEETWGLGARLPTANVAALAFLSLSFLGLFVYYNFYRRFLRGYTWEFVKRVLAIYLISLIVVGLLLTIIQQCPWGVDNAVALKRIIIVAFPASMSAAISDMLK